MPVRFDRREFITALLAGTAALGVAGVARAAAEPARIGMLAPLTGAGGP